MGLLTKEEEKRFPKEREILTAESSEGTEDENRPPSIPPQTTARGPVQMVVVQSQEKPERRLARPKKRAKRRMVTVEVSDNSVEKTVAPIVNTAEVAVGGRSLRGGKQKIGAADHYCGEARLEHVKELATLEARRAEEARIAEELRGKLADTKTAEEELRREISKIEAKYEMEF
ncbi:hypothetical protein AXG93_3822s1510 [Marchantia polymorpha subsp. ruderalis]|uniref:Uncharacterized protein n=1 Tax=Marchantia polymorpha subsp. ruderalis TaxID=1480154 RepID=A0A176WLJ4_MARPO|nr:hypothetical protein AXG93_3822s1510 [Marchantia polymorpha subsp. ruderalis]